MAQAVLSQGDIYPVRHNTTVQANAGYGEYNPASTPLAPFGSYGSYGSSPDGIGAYAVPVPQAGATKSGVLGTMLSGSPLIRGFQAMSGLGADAAPASSTDPASSLATAVAAPSALLVAAALTGIVLSGIGGYYVGKAVAPSRDREAKYAWWGVAAALLGGPVGLGIEAIVALEHK